MPELRGFSGDRVIQILKRMGFKWLRTKGSHAVLRNGERICIVPLHYELAVGTLKSILRQAGISVQEFLNNA